MRKILLILCAILTTTSVHATQMCARRDTTVIPLDSVISPPKDAYASRQIEWMWWEIYPYGNVYGIGTCISAFEIQEYFPNWAMGDSEPIIPINDDEIQGRSGYYNGDTSNREYERKYCYCKLTHPMSSRWVFRISMVADSCEQKCVAACATGGYNDPVWRMKIFNSIGYDYIAIDTNKYDESIDLN